MQDQLSRTADLHIHLLYIHEHSNQSRGIQVVLHVLLLLLLEV